LTSRIESNDNILNYEKKILKKASNILENYTHKDIVLFNEYKILFVKYKKLLEQVQYILKISDKYQKNLIETKEKLKKEIKEKYETEKELKIKIEELLNTKQKLEHTNKKLAKISSRDQLTGLYNRREFEKVINREWHDAIREAHPISIIMIDIDNFKNFNDNYGHLAGDNCLQKISQIMNNTLKRPRDFLARYGGEEFVAVLPKTNKDGAQHTAENLRKNVENLKIPHKFSTVSNYVTISLGVSSTDEAEIFVFEEILDTADQALYQAKNCGKNKYCFIQL
jgi:diguanylate cyclase (GGDEF)-like protein